MKPLPCKENKCLVYSACRSRKHIYCIELFEYCDMIYKTSGKIEEVVSTTSELIVNIRRTLPNITNVCYSMDNPLRYLIPTISTRQLFKMDPYLRMEDQRV